MPYRKFFSLFLAVLLVAGIGMSVVSQRALAEEPAVIQNLKTNGLQEPLGVDTMQPEFSWQMISNEIGAAQKAYHLVVKDEAGAVVWDSGIVESSVSIGILYEGEPLQPASIYTWSVVVTDQNGKELASEETSFETSLLDDTFASWDGAQEPPNSRWMLHPRLSFIFPPMFSSQRVVRLHLLFSEQMTSACRIKCSIPGWPRVKTMYVWKLIFLKPMLMAE